MYYIKVESSPDRWLVSVQSDPLSHSVHATTDEGQAQGFKTMAEALETLNEARRFGAYPDAEICESFI